MSSLGMFIIKQRIKFISRHHDLIESRNDQMDIDDNKHK